MKRSNNVQKYPGGGLGADGRDGNAWCDDRGWYQKMRMRLWLGCLVSQNAMSMGVKDLVTATVPRPPAPLDPKSHPAQRRRQRLNLETINQPINQSTSQPTNHPTNQPVNQTINQSTSQPNNQPIKQSTNQPINQTINQPIIHALSNLQIETSAPHYTEKTLHALASCRENGPCHTPGCQKLYFIHVR